jgi:hypothetical protein
LRGRDREGDRSRDDQEHPAVDQPSWSAESVGHTGDWRRHPHAQAAIWNEHGECEGQADLEQGRHDRGEDRGTTQCRDSGRRELMSAAGDRIPTADDGERQADTHQRRRQRGTERSRARLEDRRRYRRRHRPERPGRQ